MVVIFILICSFFLKKYSNKIVKIIFDYGTAPILGVLILVLTFSVDLNVIFAGIVGNESIQPYNILILFMSLAYVCISIDNTGFFEYLALRTAKGAGTSGKKLFIYFFLVTSLLTVFTSNDIVILTLTPIICYFAKYTNTNPIPYLIGQFFAANIWSMMLYIGNPTNIIVAEAFNFSFFEYTAWMFLPTMIAGISCLIFLWIFFKSKIPAKLDTPPIDPRSAIKDLPGAIFGISILVSCLVLLSLASWLSIDLWIITFICALIVFFRDLSQYLYKRMHKKPVGLPLILGRMPWRIIPFLLGMFIIVQSLISHGWIGLFAAGLSGTSTNIVGSVLSMGFFSALTCNVMNNQPMTILFTNILLNPAFTASSSVTFGGALALIMGSNFGANFTLIGALAGLMWYKILQDKNVNIKFTQFSKYGFLIMPIIMLIALSVLLCELFLFVPLI